MLNPHPALTGFPLVLLVLLVTVELLRASGRRSDLDRPAELLLLALVIFTPLTFLSGYLAAAGADRSVPVAPEFIESHRAAGRFLIIMLVPTVLLAYLCKAAQQNNGSRPPGLFRIYLICLFLSLAIAVRTGFLGGELVFEHAAGVRVPPTAVETNPR